MEYPECVSVLHHSSANTGWHLCQMSVISVIMKQSVDTYSVVSIVVKQLKGTYALVSTETVY
jgi:hypothetical protein